jgi:hypothetical protein
MILNGNDFEGLWVVDPYVAYNSGYGQIAGDELVRVFSANTTVQLTLSWTGGSSNVDVQLHNACRIIFTRLQ